MTGVNESEIISIQLAKGSLPTLCNSKKQVTALNLFFSFFINWFHHSKLRRHPRETSYNLKIFFLSFSSFSFSSLKTQTTSKSLPNKRLSFSGWNPCTFTWLTAFCAGLICGLGKSVHTLMTRRILNVIN